MFAVIQRFSRDFNVVLEIICENSADKDEFDRVVATITFTVAATFC
jgi:hypothetical protein